MFFLFHFVYALVALFIIVYTCSLFTNAIEHLGCKLKLGNGAVGSILAVFGTGMPEAIVPLVAIIGALIFGQDMEIGQDIALGAIIGSPFMLSTFALFLMGLVIIFQKREKLELNLDIKETLRNYKYFIFAYSVAILLGFVQNMYAKIFVTILLFFIYCVYVYRTIDKSKKCFCEKCLDELILYKYAREYNRSKEFCIYFQLIYSMIFLIIGVHFFVKEIVYFSDMYNISPFLLSLVITPFATELPECVNSIIWLKQRKDDLAIGNILGAVVFQATILFLIGILLTPWNLDNNILLNAAVVLISSVMFVLIMLICKKINLFSLLIMGMFYFGYLFFVIK